MKATTQKRVKAFVDAFIRGEYGRNGWGDSSDDWLTNADRAERCHNAAENGCDGSTHREIIQDWRDGFGNWLRDEHRRHNEGLFVDAVRAHFDEVEKWHTQHGTIDCEVG